MGGLAGPSTLTHQRPDGLRPRFLSAVRLEEAYLTTAGHTCTLLNSQISKELSDIAERCLRPHEGGISDAGVLGVEAADVQERRVLCKSCSGCNILFKQPTWSSTLKKLSLSCSWNDWKAIESKYFFSFFCNCWILFSFLLTLFLGMILDLIYFLT